MSAKTEDSSANIKIELRQLEDAIAAVNEVVDKMEEVFSVVLKEPTIYRAGVAMQGNSFSEEAKDIDPRSPIAIALDKHGNMLNGIFNRLVSIVDRCDL